MAQRGPAFSINLGRRAVSGRNPAPSESIIFAATGEGDTASPGVGFLRSLDGGKTWKVLDSTTNVDPNTGEILPISDPRRDHRFLGTTSFKGQVDPPLTTTGQVNRYAALTRRNGG